MNLESLGADPRVFAAFERVAVPRANLLLARVAQSNRDRYHLYAEPGEFAAEPSGALCHRATTAAEMPVTGDWVAARAVAPGEAIVEAVLPRATCFSRRAAGRRDQEQPLAANIDLLFLVSGLDSDFNPRRIERYLTLASAAGAQPVIVLNKSDLCAEPSALAAAARSVSGAAPVVIVNTIAPEGTAPLREFLTGNRTIALLGSSGVGKSSIANALLGYDRLRTAATRDSGTGRHTTTHRELIPLPQGGALIDTPGLRELQLWAGADSVEETFAEIAEAAARCRFRDCTHTGEPGCAVQSAIETGAIAPARWQSYQKLLAEARAHDRLTDVAAAQAHKRWAKRIHKAIRQHYKLRQ